MRPTIIFFSHKGKGTEFSNQQSTSMTTSKKSTGNTSRHISSRFYVYTSTLTQCTLIALLLTPSTVQIQAIPKIMGWSPSSGIVVNTSLNAVIFTCTERVVERTIFQTTQQGMLSPLRLHHVRVWKQAPATQTRNQAWFQWHSMKTKERRESS